MWLVTPLFSVCQDTVQTKSKIEAFAIKRDAILKKQTDHIYDYQANYKIFNFKGTYGTGNFSCDMVAVEDIATGVITKGLNLSTRTYTATTYSGYIDGKEVPELIKFFDYLATNHKYRQPEGTEYVFNCNDVRFTCFNTRDDRNQVAWLCKININTRFDKAVAYFDIHELNIFNEKLKENLNKLNRPSLQNK